MSPNMLGRDPEADDQPRQVGVAGARRNARPAARPARSPGTRARRRSGRRRPPRCRCRAGRPRAAGSRWRSPRARAGPAAGRRRPPSRSARRAGGTMISHVEGADLRRRADVRRHPVDVPGQDVLVGVGPDRVVEQRRLGPLDEGLDARRRPCGARRSAPPCPAGGPSTRWRRASRPSAGRPRPSRAKAAARTRPTPGGCSRHLCRLLASLSPNVTRCLGASG